MTPAREPHAVARAAAVAIRVYQVAVSPLLVPHCRFQPTCSEYGRQAVLRFGARRGVALAAKRLARCHPWHAGGFDPVPTDDPELNTDAHDALPH